MSLYCSLSPLFVDGTGCFWQNKHEASVPSSWIPPVYSSGYYTAKMAMTYGLGVGV